MSKTERPPLSEDWSERQKQPGLTLYEQLYGRYEEDVIEDMLNAMRKYGIHRFEATYSGGHDEGGIQEIESMVDGKGNQIEIENIHRWDHELHQAANEVLSLKFFSWALGCSVYGRFIVDMDERRAWTSGEIEEYVEDKEPMELTW